MIENIILNIFFTAFLSILVLYFNKKINYEHNYPKLFICLNIVLSIITSLKFAAKLQGLIIASVFTLLVNITLIDFKYLEIPDTYNFLVLLLGVASMFVISKNFSVIISALISFLFFYAITKLSKGALGGGDIKLAIGLGLFFNLSEYMNFLIYTFGIGSLIAALLLITKKKDKKDKIAFGPFLSLGAMLAIIL